MASGGEILASRSQSRHAMICKASIVDRIGGSGSFSRLALVSSLIRPSPFSLAKSWNCCMIAPIAKLPALARSQRL